MDEVAGGATAEEQVLATLDVKDAFLEVPQPTPLKVWLNNQWFVVLRNLPGQRLGARAWYWFIREYLTDKMQFEWCSIHPCLARSKDSVILLHVDDILYVGNQSQWKVAIRASGRSSKIHCSSGLPSVMRCWEELDQKSLFSRKNCSSQ